MTEPLEIGLAFLTNNKVALVLKKITIRLDNQHLNIGKKKLLIKNNKKCKTIPVERSLEDVIKHLKFLASETGNI